MLTGQPNHRRVWLVRPGEPTLRVDIPWWSPGLRDRAAMLTWEPDPGPVVPAAD